MKKIIIRMLALLLGAAIILNGIWVMLVSNMTAGIWMTLLLGTAIMLPAIFPLKTAAILKRKAGRAAAAAVIFICAAAILACAALFWYGNNDTADYNEDYLVVLGCGVRGDTPSLMLRSRLDTALEYIDKNKDCKIIVSGGKGLDEDISEAEAMYIYLTKRGVDGSRIIREDRSTSTTENYRFSNELAGGELKTKSVAIITTDFHIYRAESLARMQGINAAHIGSDTEWYNILPSYLRELLAIGKMYVLKY